MQANRAINRSNKLNRYESTYSMGDSSSKDMLNKLLMSQKSEIMFKRNMNNVMKCEDTTKIKHIDKISKLIIQCQTERRKHNHELHNTLS